jgi:hypothetical protein
MKQTFPCFNEGYNFRTQRSGCCRIHRADRVWQQRTAPEQHPIRCSAAFNMPLEPRELKRKLSYYIILYYLTLSVRVTLESLARDAVRYRATDAASVKVSRDCTLPSRTRLQHAIWLTSPCVSFVSLCEMRDAVDAEGDYHDSQVQHNGKDFPFRSKVF